MAVAELLTVTDTNNARVRRRGSCTVAAPVAWLALCSTGGFGLGFYCGRQPSPAAPRRSPHRLTSSALPSACLDWSALCEQAAAAAAMAQLGAYWPTAFCQPPGGYFSCQYRSSAWQAPDVWFEPAAAASGYLMLFLPGTGSMPSEYGKLLRAAASMGHHVIGLTHSSWPFSVGASSVWCSTRSDPSACNVGLHESVLFGLGVMRR